MNPKIISVELSELDEETDILRFFFDEKNLDVNLNSDTCQGELKEVFTCLLGEILVNDVECIFSYKEGYSRRFYIEACEEYVKDLNRELKGTKAKLKRALDEKT